jgi:hypothetical protein
MAQPTTAVRVAGTWFAIASSLMVGVFLSHGPIAHDLNHQMERIASGALRWSVVHWIAAAALSLYALTGLIVLTSGSRLTETRSTITAWAMLVISAIWTITTAVTEATVITRTAVSGDFGKFEAWWAFAQGMATGFSFLALAIVLIAANETRRPERSVPLWSARAAMVAGVASFAGWALGMWFGVPLGNLLWVAASLVMSLWMLWFGVALTREQASPG